ncbi:MAG: tetratricopeptide repeat protein [Promethearchaeota archaeon]
MVFVHDFSIDQLISRARIILEFMKSGKQASRGRGIIEYNLDQIYKELWQTAGMCHNHSRWQKSLELHEILLEYHKFLGGNSSLIELSLRDIGLTAKQRDALFSDLGLTKQSGVGETLYRIGVAYLRLGQLDKALEYFQQALKAQREIGDRPSEGKSLKTIGEALLLQGKYKESLKKYTQSLEIARDIGDPEQEIIVLLDIAMVYCTSGKIKKSMNSIQKALKKVNEIRRPQFKSIIFTNIGTIYRKMERAIEIYPKTAQSWLGKGLTLEELGRIDEAIPNFIQALTVDPNSLQIFEAIQRYGIDATLARRIASINHQLEKYKDSVDQQQEIRQSVDGELLALDGEVQRQFSQRQFLSSLFLCTIILNFYKTLGIRRSEARSLLNIGHAHLSLGGYEKAQEYYGQSLEIAREISDRETEGRALAHTGASYHFRGQHQEALEYLQQALPIIQELEDRGMEILTFYYTSGCYRGLKQPSEALHWIERALQITPINTDYLMLKAKILEDLERHKDAITCYQHILKLNPNLQQARDALRQLGGDT